MIEVIWQIKLLHSEYFAADKTFWNPALKKSRSLKSPICWSWGAWSTLGHKGGSFISGQLSSCKVCSQSYARIIPSM